MSPTITVPNTAAAGAAANNRKNIIIKNCTQIDNAKDIDIVMPMYNLIEYSDIYSKTSGSFWYYYKGESFLTNGNIADFLLIIITTVLHLKHIAQNKNSRQDRK